MALCRLAEKPMQNFIVYEIYDDAGNVRYVGIARVGESPWLETWRDRESLPSSPLVDWLLTLSAPPIVSPLYPEAGPMSIVNSRRWLAIRRDEIGVEQLLSCRPGETYANCGGSRPQRAVIDGNGQLHASVNAAARSNGITAGRVTQLCQKNKRGWRYA